MGEKKSNASRKAVENTPQAANPAPVQNAPAAGRLRPRLWPGLAAAVAAGLLQAVSWPNPGLWPLCLVCLTPLIICARVQTGGRAFFLGWVNGVALSLFSLTWLAEVMAGYGGLGLGGGWLILTLLAAVMGLYQGLFCWLTGRVKSKAWPLWGAVFWCGTDWLKNWVLTGFNWTPLAGPLALDPYLGQAGDLVGFYGLGLPVALVNLTVADLWLRRPGRARTQSRGAAIPVQPPRPGQFDGGNLEVLGKGWKALRFRLGALAALAAAALVYGAVQYQKWEGLAESAPKETVAVIQPSVPQDQKWNNRFRDEILARYAGLVGQAGEREPWLIVWPETAMPFIFGFDSHETDWLYTLADSVESPMLVGLAAPGGSSKNLKLYNRAWLFENGNPGNWYDKEHLVPFGEYLPLDWLPFLKWAFMQGLVGAVGSYSPGGDYEPLDVPGPFGPVRLGPLICFESTFPYLGRERALSGAGLLVVTTNDGWFGHSWAPRQHLYQASMRAIETRRPLVRAGNNGISGQINPSGRITAHSELDQVGTFFYETPILKPEQLSETFFTSFGWALAPLTAALTVLAMLEAARQGLRRRRAR